MDTPTSEPTVEFTKAGEGYDPKQVDEVVTSMRAELASLRSQVRKSSPKAARSSLSENGDRLHDPDRAVERMLAAAQQTADRVVYEAEAEAERVLAEADEEALDRINKAESKSQLRVSESDAQGERIRKEAVTEARRVVEETRGPLAREVKKLRDTRDSLRSEIDALRGLLSTHRESVRNASDALRSLADDPSVFRVADPGPLTDVSVNLDEDFEIEIPEAEIDLREEESVEAPVAAAAVESKAEGKATQAKTSSKRDKGKRAKAPAAPAKSSAVRTETKAAPAPAEAAKNAPGAPSVSRSATGSAFSDSVVDDEEVAAAPAAGARIVTLDDLKEDAGTAPNEAASDDNDNAGTGRVITGAFADQLDDESEDDLHRIGENATDAVGDIDATPASDRAGFLDTVRQAAVAENDGGLGEVDEEEGRAISNFFESAIEEPKSRFGRRKNN